MTNLNFSPEKSGEELVERADLSFELMLDEQDIAQVLAVRGNALKILWDKDGELALTELPAPLVLELEAEGTLLVGYVGLDEALEFEGARLKKCKLEPMYGCKATLTCQVRVDPTGQLEELGQLRVREDCMWGFVGRGVAPPASKQEGLKL